METLDAIRTKRAVRSYADQPVPEEVILKILDAGRRAQSSKNTQPWHFVVVRSPETLEALSRCGRYAMHVAQSAFTIAILQKTDWAFDIGQAAAYLQLAAWDLGVSSCLVYFHEPGCANQVLGAPPELGAVIAIAFGYAAHPPAPPVPGGRRPLDQIVHWERW
jgi:nitroreductase